MAPAVVVDAPAGWVATEIDKPTIAESSGARYVDWQASQSTAGGAALVTGCVATPIPGWVEDMRPAVEGRTVALAGAVAAKITGGPIDARGEEGTLALRAANDLGGPIVGRARTFVGFDDSNVLTCFATCATRAAPAVRHDPSGTGAPASPECTKVVSSARLEGALPPPKPGIGLRAATWAVHHPRPVALAGFGLVVLAGMLAVALRRRPRSRIDRPRCDRG